MERQFTVELGEDQAQLINTILPRNHSMQIFEKYQRRKKAEKKLDSMYVAEFSLRPVKKIKKEIQTPSQKNKKYNPNDDRHQMQETLERKNQKPEQKSKLQMHAKPSHNISNKIPVESHEEKQIQQAQPAIQRFSRSQRTSKPTEAYIQFQEETFKRKPIQKQKQKFIQPLTAKPLKQIIESHLKGSGNINQVQIKQKEHHKAQQKQQIKQKPPKSESFKQKLIENNTIHKAQQQQHFQQQKQQLIHQKPYGLRKDPVKKEHFQNIQAQKPIKQTTSIISDYKPILPGYLHAVQPSKVAQQLFKKKAPSILDPLQLIQNKKRRQNLPHNKFPRIHQQKQLSQQQPLLTRCWRILKRLQAHKSSWPFRRPVNPITQGVPDYLQIISNPMDLRTIQRRFRGQKRQKKYQKQQQFYQDVQLMLNNSFLYNPRQSKYYKLTQQLQKYFSQLRQQQFIQKLTGRNVDQDQDPQQSSNSEFNQEEQPQQEDEQQLLLQEQLQEKRKKMLAGEISDELSGGKRKASHGNTEKKHQNSKLYSSKVIITSQGVIRKAKIQSEGLKRYNDQKIYAQQMNNQEQMLPNKQRSIQKNQSKGQNSSHEIKQSKPMKQLGNSEKKKSLDTLNDKQRRQQQIAQNKDQKPQKSPNQFSLLDVNKKSLRFGYFEPKIAILQRETLLYDVLHLKNPSTQLQLHEFLQRNDQIFHRFKHFSKEKQIKSKQIKQNEQTKNNQTGHQGEQSSSSEEYDLQLKNLDPESFIVLRREVNRLLRLQEKQLIIGSAQKDRQNQRGQNVEIVNEDKQNM